MIYEKVRLMWYEQTLTEHHHRKNLVIWVKEGCCENSW